MWIADKRAERENEKENSELKERKKGEKEVNKKCIIVLADIPHK